MSAAARPQGPVVVVGLMRERGGTGLQTHARTYRDHLRLAGEPVALVTPFSHRSALRAPVFGVRLALAPLSGAASVWWHRRWHAAFLARALRPVLAAHPDAVVYAQCPVSAGVALDVRDALGSAQPVVMAAHFNVSQADEWAGKGDIVAGGRLYDEIRAGEADVLPRLDGVVHVSAHTRDALEARHPRLRDVPAAVVPNFVDPVSRGPSEPTGDLVTVGALEPRKNQGYLLDVLAEAARLDRRPTLTVVGDGPDHAALERRAAALGLAGQVRFTGRLDDPRTVVARHRVYVHAATAESFGVALLEAMAEGVPVLAGGVGGVPEVVRPGLDGDLWPLDDAPAAARLLVGLLDDRARLFAMGTRAADRAATSFATGVVADRLTAFLRGVRVRSRSAAPASATSA